MDYNKLSETANAAAAANGWNDKKEDHGTSIALIKTELSEAMDAFRNNSYCKMTPKELQKENSKINNIDDFSIFYKKAVKETFEEEVSDIAIRILHYSGYYGLTLGDSAIMPTKEKGLFNKDFIAIDKILTSLYDNNSRQDQTSVFTIVLRMLESISEVYGFDLEQHINLKLAYNATRGYKHGNKVL